MFNPVHVVIDAFVEYLEDTYRRNFGRLEPEYPGIIAWSGRMALENIANSDALYHNVNHTIMVTQVGQEILKAKHLRQRGVSPRDWLHFVVSLLCHDLGYLRGLCSQDRDGVYATGVDGGTVELPPGSTDAALAPYHVDRGQLFVRERFADSAVIDAEIVAANIERTRFPVPADADHQGTDDFPGLLRAADLIGQLADPNQARRFPALFFEFREIGETERLGYGNPDDLRAGYPAFFWKAVAPYIHEAVTYLQVTSEGRQWVANLYARVNAEQNGLGGRL